MASRLPSKSSILAESLSPDQRGNAAGVGRSRSSQMCRKPTGQQVAKRMARLLMLTHQIREVWGENLGLLIYACTAASGCASVLLVFLWVQETHQAADCQAHGQPLTDAHTSDPKLLGARAGFILYLHPCTAACVRLQIQAKALSVQETHQAEGGQTHGRAHGQLSPNPFSQPLHSIVI